MFKNKIVVATSAFFVVITIVALGFVINGLYQDAVHPKPTEADVKIAQKHIEDQSEDIDEVAGDIAGAHKTLNDLTGWGNDASFVDKNSASWNSEKVAYDNIQSYLADAVAQTDDELRDDLIMAKKLNQIAFKKHDHEALIMSHRVLHDLDNAINGDVHEGVFDAARAGLGDAKKVSEYEKFITVEY